MKVKVVKLSKNLNTYSADLNNLTYMPEEPKVGQCLRLLNPHRFGEGIYTSVVTEVVYTPTGVYTVKTLNSIYEITVVPDLRPTSS